MRLAVKHRWKVTTQEARQIQEKLREKWIGEDRFGELRTVAGLDAAFILTRSQAFKKKASRWNVLREANQAIAAVVVYKYPEMTEIERAFAVVKLEFPYVPGFLSFREIPALLAALEKLHEVPDLLFCDGQGIAHPRRMGLATHLGIVLDRPSIGCAKSVLIGEHGVLAEEQGAWTPLKIVARRSVRHYAHEGSGQASLCLRREPGIAGDGLAIDTCGERRRADSATDAGSRPFCEPGEA